MVATVQAFHACDDAAAPDPVFVQRLWQTVDDRVGTSKQVRRRPSFAHSSRAGSGMNLGRWPLAGLAAAAVAAVLLGIYFIAARPAPVSADEIVRRAQEAAWPHRRQEGSTSFVIKLRGWSSRSGDPRSRTPSAGSRESTGGEEIRSETKRWYENANRWRIESSGTTVDGSRKGAARPGLVLDERWRRKGRLALRCQRRHSARDRRVRLRQERFLWRRISPGPGHGRRTEGAAGAKS